MQFTMDLMIHGKKVSIFATFNKKRGEITAK